MSEQSLLALQAVDKDWQERGSVTPETVDLVRSALNGYTGIGQEAAHVGYFTEVSPGRWEQSIDPNDPKNAQYIKDCNITFENTVKLYAAPQQPALSDERILEAAKAVDSKTITLIHTDNNGIEKPTFCALQFASALLGNKVEA